MDAYGDLLGPYCLDVRVRVRFEVNFYGDLGPQGSPKSVKKRSREALRRHLGQSVENVWNTGPNLRPWTLPKCDRGLENRGFLNLRIYANWGSNLVPFGVVAGAFETHFGHFGRGRFSRWSQCGPKGVL